MEEYLKSSSIGNTRGLSGTKGGIILSSSSFALSSSSSSSSCAGDGGGGGGNIGVDCDGSVTDAFANAGSPIACMNSKKFTKFAIRQSDALHEMFTSLSYHICHNL